MYKRQVVNHAGSVLLTEPLELTEDGRLMLTEEEYADFTERLSHFDMSQAEFIRQAITRATIRPIITLSLIHIWRGPVPSAGRCSCRAPIGANTVTSAPPMCAGERKLPANGNAAGVDI